MANLTVQFIRPRDEAVGPTLGPYTWVQITYEHLRVSPDGDIVASFNPDLDDWFLENDPTGEPWSDFVIG